MAQRILSAGAVVVRPVDGSWRLLLLRAYNYWDCPKGVVEPGEDPLTTARREVREEASIDDLDFRWGEEFIETPPYSKDKVARYYLAATTRETLKLPISPELERPEHHEYRWLAFENAEALVVPRLVPVLRWALARISTPEALA